MNTELCSFLKRRQKNNKHTFLTIMLVMILLFSSISVYAAGDFNIDISSYNTTEYPVSMTKNASGRKVFAYNISNFVSNIDDTLYVYGHATINASSCDADSGFSVLNGQYATSNSGVGLTYLDQEHRLYVPTTTSQTTYQIDFVYYVNYGQNSKYNYINFVMPYYNGDITIDSIYISNNEPSNAWTGPATVSVEAGCVAYILIDGGTANLSTTFPELSKLSRPLWVSGSTYSFEEDLPSSGKVFSSTTGTVIDWLIPASAKKDLLGRSYVGGRPLSDLPTGQFLVIYNPVYRGYDDKGVGIMSPTIYVSLSNYAAVRQYRLTASYNGGLIESTSEDGYTSWFDSIGEEELDSSGNPIYIEHNADGTTSAAINIPAGGGNIIIDTENADNSLGGLLQRLVNLLSAPVRYIENLFNAGVGFFTMLASLWSWLPTEVSTIIASALIVLVVIGVVKFLWK